MTNNDKLTYRIINKLKRSEANHDENQDTQTYLIHDQKENDEKKYILRSIDLEKLTNLSEFLKDIAWYRQLNHLNLMPLKDCFLADSKLNLVKPYASFGSCADLLHSHPYGVCERLISHIIWQTLQALRYLQDKHIMHRAIATKNIYLCDSGRVLLDNFSHCVCMISPLDGKLKKQIYDYSEKLKDQVLYLAPEVIHQNKDGYNLKSDIYSLGTVACELANGSNTYIHMPYGNLSMLYAKIQGLEPMLLDQSQLTAEMMELSDDNNSLYIEEIKQRKYTKEFHSFVKSCVSINLATRCSSDELHIHSFFKYQKRLSNDQNLLYNDMAQVLKTYQTKQSVHKKLNDNEQIFANSSNDSDEKQTITWEF